MKTAITYASAHHHNTKKIVEAMASVISTDMIDITKEKDLSLVSYDVLGFASGIYFHTFHEDLVEYIKETDFPKNQKVFLVYTCGVAYRDYARGIREILKRKNISCIGTFSCRG